MLSKPVPTNVVDLDSSDDETDAGARTTPNKSPGKKPMTENRPQAQNSESRPPPPATGEEIELRSFWKAGNYSVGPTKWAPLQGQLEHARVHPKFLHSNATSHKWAFGAIAELLDNAVDEIVNGATFVKVDRIYNAKDNSPALLFVDDGGGMDPEGIRKCMSLGYSSKKSNTTIGQYGNGFKTSTMRLGADVIVFSRASTKGRATQSVGLLSYTFLRKTGQDDVIVPMVDFDISNHWAEPIVYSSEDDWSTNLKNILEWSPFESKDELLQQFEDIGAHGTKLIIYNLWLNDEGIYELNFDDDDEDIKLRDESNHGNVHRSDKKKVLELQSHISYRLRFSLREYASMLYLRRLNNFQIILRGTPVEQFNIADELMYPKKFYYKPQLAIKSKEVTVETTIGFIKEAPIPISGFNVYHKNRLIRPFWKVTLDGSSLGNSVVGVLETNFIEPAHDKQDFERSSLFIRLEMKLKQMTTEYWRGHCHLIGYQPYDMRKRNPTPPSVGRMVNAPKQLENGHSAIQLSGKGHMEYPGGSSIIGLAANTRQEAQVINLAAGSSVQEVAYAGSSMTDEQICEENIQLFRKCEEHAEKENQLMLTIKDLEKQLAETKKQCAQLSAHLESKRKQKLIQVAENV